MADARFNLKNFQSSLMTTLPSRSSPPRSPSTCVNSEAEEKVMKLFKLRKEFRKASQQWRERKKGKNSDELLA
jgi:hypothetical protein